jgi:hypothetical protein
MNINSRDICMDGVEDCDSLALMGDGMFNALIRRIESNPNFKPEKYFLIRAEIRKELFARLVLPEDFQGNDRVSKEEYETRYHILRVMGDYDFSSAPIYPNYFKVDLAYPEDEVRKEGNYWLG